MLEYAADFPSPAINETHKTVRIAGLVPSRSKATRKGRIQE
jgi:hypothetical protein